MFGAFIVLCGLTHLVEVLMTVHPMYRFSGLVKLATAAVSATTFFALLPLLPAALALRSPRELDELNRRLELEVSERRKAQEGMARLNVELRQKEDFARSVMESASDAIVSADEDGTIVSWNKGAQAIFGYTVEEAVGRPLTLLMPERHRDAHRKGLERLKAGGESRLLGRTVEIEGLRKDGAEFPIELRVDAWSSGGRRFFTGIVRDITERRRREEEILKLNKELEAFSYSVSHDLRTPLRAIDGYSRMLQEDCGPALDDTAKRYIDVIRSGTQRMGRLIDDLLTFSRTGRKPLDIFSIDVAAVVHSAFEEVEAAHPGREIELRVGELPRCFGDPALIRQVFVNLLSNAVKYTRGRRPGIIEVSGRLEGGEAVYAVKDNGVGFDMKYADKLFGVFQRLHSAREFEGTGVGLALVQRIVQRHGGRVWAEGEVDQGATFYIALPGREVRHAGSSGSGSPAGRG